MTISDGNDSGVRADHASWSAGGRRRPHQSVAAANDDDMAALQVARLSACHGRSGAMMAILTELVETGIAPTDLAIRLVVEAEGLLLNNVQLLMPDRELAPFVRLEAVRQNGHAVQFILNATIEEMLAAVSQNGMALRHLSSRSLSYSERKEVIMAAIRQTPLAIRHARHAEEDLKLAAVRANGLVIAALDLPSVEIQVAAVRQNRHALAAIHNPCREAVAIALRST